MTLLYSLTILFSSILLFLIQPLVSKMILPLFGGTPSVWTSCMLFFQVVLLAGYGYAHFLANRFSLKIQMWFHGCLLVLAGLSLPFQFSEKLMASFSWQSNPVFLLLWILLLGAGFPFFVLSAGSPIIQKWFSRTTHVSAGDPYFLFAASNAGSLLAILSYPLFVEPAISLENQSRLWAWGYAVLVILFGLMGGATWFFRNRAQVKKKPEARASDSTTRLTVKRRAIWIVLAFIPSSLMLGVTTHLTTDIASVPLLWVIPLAIYLLSFILVYSRKNLIPLSLVTAVFPVTVVVTVFMMLTEIEKPVWLVFLVYLLFFFMAAMACHGRLSRDRPDSSHLTSYYVYISIGGALGGIFNAILSPLIFNKVTELPLVLVLACLMFSGRSRGKWRPGDFLYPAAIGIFTAILAAFLPRLTLEPYQLWMFVIFGLPLIGGYALARRPVGFGLAIGAILLGSIFYPDIYGRVIHSERNFFGHIRINYDKTGPYHRLFYGTTQHGLQFTLPGRRQEALAYYHRSGPFGDIFEAFRAGAASDSVGVIGLGIGSMLSYSSPGQKWTFYEIDPAVIRIARDTRFFTHVADAGAGRVTIVTGDARLMIRKVPNREYGLLIVDAFNSDAIPVHLITREAFTLYLSKLSHRGLLAIHITNKNLDLTPVVRDMAQSLGLFCVFRYDSEVDAADESTRGKFRSLWAVMTRNMPNLGPILKKTGWRVLPPSENPRPWTDDFSNIIGVLKWF
jgi:hypothetical protein